MFSKRYSKRELWDWIERYERQVLEATNSRLIEFAKSVETKLLELENDLIQVAKLNVKVEVLKQAEKKEELDVIRTEFAKEAVNEIIRKAKIELKNEAMEILIANSKYQSIKDK